MKKLDLNQMEIINAGDKLAPCGAAIIMGGMIGSWFGGIGGLLGMASVATGPNCLGWWGPTVTKKTHYLKADF